MVVALTVRSLLFFFFTDTAPTEIYTLSLHDALPICCQMRGARRNTLPHRTHLRRHVPRPPDRDASRSHVSEDRKSTRLNSSHSQISYAVFCLKKKNTAQPESSEADVCDLTSPTALNP